jgi:hypothetical protein
MARADSSQVVYRQVDRLDSNTVETRKEELVSRDGPIELYTFLVPGHNVPDGLRRSLDERGW